MNPLFRQLITKTVKRYLGKARADKISDYAIAKQAINLKVTARRLFKDIVFISLGILATGFGLGISVTQRGNKKTWQNIFKSFGAFCIFSPH